MIELRIYDRGLPGLSQWRVTVQQERPTGFRLRVVIHSPRLPEVFLVYHCPTECSQPSGEVQLDHDSEDKNSNQKDYYADPHRMAEVDRYADAHLLRRENALVLRVKKYHVTKFHSSTLYKTSAIVFRTGGRESLLDECRFTSILTLIVRPASDSSRPPSRNLKDHRWDVFTTFQGSTSSPDSSPRS